MTINKSLQGTELIVTLVGRLDTNTAQKLEAELEHCYDGIDSLVMDFAGLEYLSSAGLRVLLGAQKIMNRQGTMTIRHANTAVREVLEVTCFTDIITMEE